MRRILSTYRYVRHPLTPELLQEISRAEIPNIEIFCAPLHFNYRAPEAVRELAGSLERCGIQLHALHSPAERDLSPGREGARMSISDPERIRRSDAVDEVKRALEVAERIPFRYLVQHICSGKEPADPRKLDAAFGSLEILHIFAKHRGVTICLENTPGELSSPETLDQFIKDTHLNDLRFCFDIGHAHIESGVAASFKVMKERVATVHIHDNRGDKDEHLLPFEGTIEWDEALRTLAGAPGAEELPLVLELKELDSGGPAIDDIRAVFDRLEKHIDNTRSPT